MKRLILLLFIPILSYSQISYKDVMSIKSVDTFKKVVIENGYEYESLDEEGWLTYGFNIVKDIKEKCKYYKIINYNGIDYVSYGCSESSYKGKIGFVVSEGSGIIRHFPID